MRKHLSTYSNIDSEFVTKVINAFYVEDFSSGDNNLESVLLLYKKLKIRFYDPQLRNLINTAENSTGSTDSSDTEQEATKHLGWLWNDRTDELLFQLRDFVKNESNHPPTKRNVLKIIATFYDPIGLIQPIIVSLKILFQQICKTDCGWDDVIPDHLTKRWNEIVNELKNMDTVRVNTATQTTKLSTRLCDYMGLMMPVNRRMEHASI